jgi:hypothetical protein
MNRLALAAVAVLLSASARAEVAVFDAGALPPDGALYSADGYHYAYLESDDREDDLIVDGRARAKGKPGTLGGPAVLSADGATLLHFVAVPGGWSPAINGRRVGKKAFAEIASAAMSASGRNVAYAARTAEGWVVASGQGTGPAFPKPPSLLQVSDKSTAYVVGWQGRPWLYRDHKPVLELPDDQPAISADLSRVAYAGEDRAAGGFYAVVDGKRIGPWRRVGAPGFSPDGRHYAFLASEPPQEEGVFNVLIVDGRRAPMTPCGDCTLVVDNGGRAFQDELLMSVGEKAQVHRFSLDGKALGRPPRVGSSSRGTHFAYSALTGRGEIVAVDGKMVEPHAPLALPIAAPAFDGEDEFHYWALVGHELLLVCAAVDASVHRPTRCANRARFSGWGSADELLEPPSSKR